MNNDRPPNLPKCRHGITCGFRGNCPDCVKETAIIKEAVTPLYDEFWNSKGKSELNHLFARAYRMGMEHGAKE